MQKHGLVTDTEGKEFLTKLTKPVPLDSSRQASSPPTSRPVLDTLRPYAIQLRDLLGARGKKPGSALRDLTAQAPNFPTALKATGLSFNAFIHRFPQYLRRNAGNILPANQATLK